MLHLEESVRSLVSAEYSQFITITQCRVPCYAIDMHGNAIVLCLPAKVIVSAPMTLS